MFFLIAAAALTFSIHSASAQVNQTEVSQSARTESLIDELLAARPVLSELMEENATGVFEYLNSLETQDATQTLLALQALQPLLELQSTQEVAEANQTAITNQTVP